MKASIKVKRRSNKPIVKFAKGYNLSGTVNIIPDGVLHSDNNSIPKEHALGDKGIPMVACNLDNSACVKTAEVEKDELIIHNKLNKIVEKHVNEYNATGDEDILLKLGNIFWKELHYNTLDYTNKFLK